jgi:hypothetical protein
MANLNTGNANTAALIVSLVQHMTQDRAAITQLAAAPELEGNWTQLALVLHDGALPRSLPMYGREQAEAQGKKVHKCNKHSRCNSRHPACWTDASVDTVFRTVAAHFFSPSKTRMLPSPLASLTPQPSPFFFTSPQSVHEICSALADELRQLVELPSQRGRDRCVLAQYLVVSTLVRAVSFRLLVLRNLTYRTSTRTRWSDAQIGCGIEPSKHNRDYLAAALAQYALLLPASRLFSSAAGHPRCVTGACTPARLPKESGLELASSTVLLHTVTGCRSLP